MAVQENLQTLDVTIIKELKKHFHKGGTEYIDNNIIVPTNLFLKSMKTGVKIKLHPKGFLWKLVLLIMCIMEIYFWHKGIITDNMFLACLGSFFTGATLAYIKVTW